jgi:hypothetical protein
MSGKIKEYVNKMFFLKKNLPHEIGPSKEDATSNQPQKEKSYAASYRKTRNP